MTQNYISHYNLQFSLLLWYVTFNSLKTYHFIGIIINPLATKFYFATLQLALR